MVGNPLAVKMIQSTIDKSLRDIQDNPKRGVQNLANLANRFASSPFQKDLIENLQHNYDTIPSLVERVNHRTLKTFIMNIAHNSWSYGGKKIKQYKKVYNYNIPWTIIFDFTNKTNGKLSNDMIIRIIDQGKKIGIYSYLFFTDNISDLSDILRQNLDCAFIIYVPPMALTGENIVKMKSYHNTFFSVLYEPHNISAFNDATNLLFEHKCLFGSHRYYSNNDVENILSNRWINEMIQTKSPFGFLIESKDCSLENASLIHHYIDYQKTNQRHPIFLIDLYEDISKIDTLFSGHPCVLKIVGNEDIDNTSLIELLSK